VSEYELLNKASNDELVNNTSVIPIRQSRHRDLNEFFEGDQTDTAVKNLANDLAEGSDLLLTTKRMKITDGSENPSPVAVSEIPEGKFGGSPIEVVISGIPEGKCEGSPIEIDNSQPVGFPEIEFEDDLESINLASWAAIEVEARISSHFSTPSRISCRRSVFEKDIFSADASFGTIFFSWFYYFIDVNNIFLSSFFSLFSCFYFQWQVVSFSIFPLILYTSNCRSLESIALLSVIILLSIGPKS
jgi:hypothetical protein